VVLDLVSFHFLCHLRCIVSASSTHLGTNLFKDRRVNVSTSSSILAFEFLLDLYPYPVYQFQGTREQSQRMNVIVDHGVAGMGFVTFTLPNSTAFFVRSVSCMFSHVLHTHTCCIAPAGSLTWYSSGLRSVTSTTCAALQSSKSLWGPRYLELLLVTVYCDLSIEFCNRLTLASSPVIGVSLIYRSTSDTSFTFSI
jgi:hypothetical protein